MFENALSARWRADAELSLYTIINFLIVLTVIFLLVS